MDFLEHLHLRINFEHSPCFIALICICSMFQHVLVSPFFVAYRGWGDSGDLPECLGRPLEAWGLRLSSEADGSFGECSSLQFHKHYSHSYCDFVLNNQAGILWSFEWLIKVEKAVDIRRIELTGEGFHFRWTSSPTPSRGTSRANARLWPISGRPRSSKSKRPWRRLVETSRGLEIVLAS